MSQNERQLDEMAGRQRPPSATYRLQFNRDFTLAQATEIAPYLRDLGISHCYASPLFQAGPQSTHGYDVCRFDAFHPAIGSRQDFEAWSACLRGLGLQIILDMVPNHMGADLSNRWWADVLLRGRQSPFAPYFDIDWQPLQADLQNKVLLPTLEDYYVRVLEAGKLRLVYSGGVFELAYYDRQFPIALPSYLILLEQIAAAIDPTGESPAARELAATLETLRQRLDLPDLTSRLDHWDRTWPAFHDALGLVCRQFNGEPNRPRSFDHLHALLRQQHYRLAFWRVGAEEINYRRFFDVTELVSLRMELPLVFRACHQLVFELLQEGQISGLRVDHPDGLWDPKEYFRRLQSGFLLTQFPSAKTPTEDIEADISGWLTEQLFPLEQRELEEPATPSDAARSPRPSWPLYVVAEKILSGDEPLRRDWPVAGTTGYDFLNQVNGLFVDFRNESAFDTLYRDFTGVTSSFPDLVWAGKKRILEFSLVSELHALAHRLKDLARRTRSGQDFTLSQLRSALIAVIAAFPVYRTYATLESDRIIPREQTWIERAVRDAQARTPALDEIVFNFIRDLLRLRPWPDFDETDRQQARDFVLRFQQLTGPVMAKGLEDTAFYRFNRLVSLNEVGGNPGRFGVSPDAFHRFNQRQAADWPHTMLATATHDTKRGEDVRARINVLSEIPGEWQAAVSRWHERNAGQRLDADGEPAPDPNDEYLLYQVLVGAWPWPPDHTPTPEELAGFRDRTAAYMLKAVREAKTHTDWEEPNGAYEQATQEFVRRLLDPVLSGPFGDDFRSFQRKISFFGAVNSLAQLSLKVTCPGVPDFYQGTELWDFTLVDPDNRRPVDYSLRRQYLRELQNLWGKGPAARPKLLEDLLRTSTTGRLKMHLLWRSLDVRRRLPSLFSQGDYLPLRVEGPQRAHVCAFARTSGEHVSLTIVPRLPLRLVNGEERWPVGESVWQDTRLELEPPRLAGHFTNALTGEQIDLTAGPNRLPIHAALATFPVALLAR